MDVLGGLIKLQVMNTTKTSGSRVALGRHSVVAFASMIASSGKASMKIISGSASSILFHSYGFSIFNSKPREDPANCQRVQEN